MTVGQDCRLCPRLVDFRKDLRQRFPEYHNNPVQGFGCKNASLLIVGLAPGIHGANKTGRPFTGDASGNLLFDALYQFGFASLGVSHDSADGMKLADCRITNAIKCVPPENRPQPIELNTCNRFLTDELGSARVILVLGSQALCAVALAMGLRKSAFTFEHGAEYKTPYGSHLLVSYHPSQRNINTGKLNAAMFFRLFERIAVLLG